MTEMKFFVYGSLCEGQIHFEKIKGFITAKESATLSATTYRLKVGYPVILEEGADQVPGCLLTVQTNELLSSLLDQFHGVNDFEPNKGLHYRKEVSVITAQGPQTAFVYFLNPAKLPKTATRIEGGDWVESLSVSPALTSTLTERQKHYITKLGQVTGRDIVPINDLSLYRELMNLELIVDKGRRLALSKLGHEVYRYLG